MSDAESIAAAAADTTSAVVETAIESAVAETEQAQQTAEAMAAALADTTRGEQIRTLETGIEECRTAIRELPAQMQSQMEASLATLAQGMATANADALAALQMQIDALRPIQSTLQPQPEPEPPQEPAPSEEIPAAEETPVRKKRHRFL